MSVVEIGPASAAVRLLSLDGVASDRVSRIDLTGANGAIIMKVPVTANVYHWKPAAPVPVQTAMAVGRDGAPVAELWRR